MKVLALYSGYLPGEKYGGPVSSLFNFSELLGEDIDIFIMCLNHDLNENKVYDSISDGWNSVGKVKVIYIKDRDRNLHFYRKVVNDINPDLIYVSSIFSARFNAPIYSVARKQSIPILLAPRGEFNERAMAKGKLRKNVFLKLIKLEFKSLRLKYQATSIDEYNDILQRLKVKNDDVFLIPNIPSLPESKSKINKVKDKLKMCFVGRMVTNKNLSVCLEALKAVDTEVTFDIYGPTEDASYWEYCKRIISELPPNIVVNYCGTLGQLAMRSRYIEYDCLISPTKFENYGQSIVEAMLHDTPVIISQDTTPWNEIENSKAGFVVPLTNLNGYAKAIDAIGKMDEFEYLELVNNLREFVKRNFDFSGLKKKYLEVFASIVESEE